MKKVREIELGQDNEYYTTNAEGHYITSDGIEEHIGLLVDKVNEIIEALSDKGDSTK
jgi:hypothetical protein